MTGLDDYPSDMSNDLDPDIKTASIRLRSVSGSHEAGPIVATILVRRMKAMLTVAVKSEGDL